MKKILFLVTLEVVAKTWVLVDLSRAAGLDEDQGQAEALHRLESSLW